MGGAGWVGVDMWVGLEGEVEGWVGLDGLELICR